MLVRRGLIVVACLVAWPAPFAAAAAAETPVQSAPTTVVPSAGLPAQVSVGRSNANLSVTSFRHRIFMVFRTAKWQITALTEGTTLIYRQTLTFP
jgi:hypothetical protein